MTLSNPLNLLLIPPILYLAFRIVFPSHPPSTKVVPGEYDAEVYNWMPAKHPEVIVHRKYTAPELAELDGKGGGRILLAIMRVGRDGKVSRGLERTVFDVSNGRSFYGPDGMYGNFAGRDASRGMAKQSFDEEMLTPVDQALDALDDLTQSEVDNMRGWHEHFERKYTVCGELVEASV